MQPPTKKQRKMGAPSHNTLLKVFEALKENVDEIPQKLGDELHKLGFCDHVDMKSCPSHFGKCGLCEATTREVWRTYDRNNMKPICLVCLDHLLGTHKTKRVCKVFKMVLVQDSDGKWQRDPGEAEEFVKTYDQQWEAYEDIEKFLKEDPWKPDHRVHYYIETGVERVTQDD